MTRPDPAPEVTVLGAGIVGICSALSLAEKGLRVRLIDRGLPGQATSYGNAGVISPWSVVPQSMPGLWKKLPGMLLDPHSPLTVRPGYFPRVAGWGLRFVRAGQPARVAEISDAMHYLTRDCVDLFRHHLSGTGREDLITDSWYVHAFRNPVSADPNELGYRMRRQRGAEIERIGSQELRSLEPALSPDFRAGIVIRGQARARSPGTIGSVLADKFRAMGGEIRNETVRAIRPDETGGWVYDTDTGSSRSPRLVLAMGAWSAALLRPLGIRIPMEAERGYHVTFSDPGTQLHNSVLDMDRKFVASSMIDGLRVSGTAEFAGLDAPENQRRIDRLLADAKRMLPELRASEFSTWSGQRPSLPDSLPCIGEVEEFPGLICAFGHSHFGLMMAPKTGVVVAGLVTDSIGNSDLAPYRPHRFQKPRHS